MDNVQSISRRMGLVSSWNEEGCSFSVTRNATNKPSLIQSRRGRWVDQECLFNYDSSGNFTGISGFLDSIMLSSLVAEAVGLHVNASYILAQSAVPTILLSSATAISATGAITGLTALPYVPAGVVKVYCFAQAGLAAGLYYATFSSTTACQLYTDAAGTVTPTGITAAAYASGIGQVNLASFAIPGGLLGNNGAICAREIEMVNNNSATSKFVCAQLSSQNICQLSNTTLTFYRGVGFIRNRGVPNRQVVNPYTGFGGTNATAYPTIDTTVDQLLTITGQLGAATDFTILEGYTIEILPGA